MAEQAIKSPNRSSLRFDVFAQRTFGDQRTDTEVLCSIAVRKLTYNEAYPYTTVAACLFTLRPEGLCAVEDFTDDSQLTRQAYADVLRVMDANRAALKRFICPLLRDAAYRKKLCKDDIRCALLLSRLDTAFPSKLKSALDMHDPGTNRVMQVKITGCKDQSL